MTGATVLRSMKKIAQYRPPILTWIFSYDRKLLAKDLSAGVAVFILLIPQGLAYALLAGLPAIYGLYAAGVPLFVYTVFGTSRQLAVGPMAISCLLSGEVVGQLRDDSDALLQEESAEWVRASVALALLTGVLLLVMGMLGAHRLTRGLSGSVLSGFTTGAACTIFLSQLPQLLGLSLARRPYAHQTLVEICTRLGDANAMALLLGLGTAAALQAAKHWKKKSVPAAAGARTLSAAASMLHWASRFSLLVAVLITTLLSWALHNYSGLSCPIIGSVPRGLPSPQCPSLSPALHLQLLPGAAMIAVVTFAGNWAVAKKFAEKYNYPVVGSSEMMAHGLCNVVGSFFQSCVVAGGLARSAVNAEGGAQTPLAGFFSGACILVALQCFTSLFYYLPLATLGAIIVVSVVSMMDFHVVVHAYQKGFYRDCGIIAGTALITFFAGANAGLLLGVALSIAGLMYSTAAAEFSSSSSSSRGGSPPGWDEVEDGRWIPTSGGTGGDSFRIVKMSSLLYFGNLDNFKETVQETSRSLARLLSLKAVVDFDTTCPLATAAAEVEERAVSATACLVGAVVVDASSWGHYLELSSVTALEDLRVELLRPQRAAGETAPSVTVKLGLVNCHPAVLTLLSGVGVIDKIGPSMIFNSTADCLRHCERRLQQEDMEEEGNEEAPQVEAAPAAASATFNHSRTQNQYVRMPLHMDIETSPMTSK